MRGLEHSKKFHMSGCSIASYCIIDCVAGFGNRPANHADRKSATACCSHNRLQQCRWEGVTSAAASTKQRVHRAQGTHLRRSSTALLQAAAAAGSRLRR